MGINTTKQDEQSVHISQKKTLLRLYRYLLFFKKEVILVFLIMAISISITLINPLIIERAIDIYITNKDWTGLLRLGMFAVVINIILVILIKIRMYVMAKVSNKVLLVIREELYKHIQTLSFQFFDSRPTGKILARIIGDVNSLKEVLSNSVTTLIPDFITVCAVVVIMLIKNYKLGLASLISLPIMIIGVTFVQIKAHKRWQVYRKKGSNLNAFIHEDLSGMNIIQCFHAQQEVKETFDVLLEEYKTAFIKAVQYADAFGPIVDFCWGIGTLSMYFFGVHMIQKNMATVGLLVAFASYIGMFWNPVLNLSNFYNQLVTNIAGAERIFEILDTKPSIVDAEGIKDLPPIKGQVDFEHVYFSYDLDKQILKDINFSVKAGEMIALIGPTGAGKTTIVNLISRFYDVTDGKVLIDGFDVSKVSLESLRSQLGIMTQENFLFTGTIKENIKYGNLNATDKEIVEAAKAVNAHEFIMKMENGYDTTLQERGEGLSIGQRQLLAFARTMVSKPKILILDEATSSIDTHTEQLVQSGIANLLKGRTSFVIAHRLSTIKQADRIFVIDQGGILEQGAPEELMKMKGLYYQLYMAQFEEELKKVQPPKNV